MYMPAGTPTPLPLGSEGFPRGGKLWDIERRQERERKRAEKTLTGTYEKRTPGAAEGPGAFVEDEQLREDRLFVLSVAKKAREKAIEGGALPEELPAPWFDVLSEDTETGEIVADAESARRYAEARLVRTKDTPKFTPDELAEHGERLAREFLDTRVGQYRSPKDAEAEKKEAAAAEYRKKFLRRKVEPTPPKETGLTSADVFQEARWGGLARETVKASPIEVARRLVDVVELAPEGFPQSVTELLETQEKPTPQDVDKRREELRFKLAARVFAHASKAILHSVADFPGGAEQWALQHALSGIAADVVNSRQFESVVFLENALKKVWSELPQDVQDRLPASPDVLAEAASLAIIVQNFELKATRTASFPHSNLSEIPTTGLFPTVLRFMGKPHLREPGDAAKVESTLDVFFKSPDFTAAVLETIAVMDTDEFAELAEELGRTYSTTGETFTDATPQTVRDALERFNEAQVRLFSSAFGDTAWGKPLQAYKAAMVESSTMDIDAYREAFYGTKKPV